MDSPCSDHFSTIRLDDFYNIDKKELQGRIGVAKSLEERYDKTLCRSIPFQLGFKGEKNVVLLDQTKVFIPTENITFQYLLFLHQAEDNKKEYAEEYMGDSNKMGGQVSSYLIHYDDGEVYEQNIRRRFEIQQSRVHFGASAFCAVPSNEDKVLNSSLENTVLRKIHEDCSGTLETRAISGRASGIAWIYALENPYPEKKVVGIELIPKKEKSILYGISYTELIENPTVSYPREKFLLTLPEGIPFNIIGEAENLSVDLGTIISARQQYKYEHDQWTSDQIDCQPERCENACIVEVSAHPKAKLYLEYEGKQYCFPLNSLEPKAQLVHIPQAKKPIRIVIRDKKSKKPLSVRFHLHGEAGEYLPPKGHHRKVNTGFLEDQYAENQNKFQQYCYIQGECWVDVPIGKVYIELSRGFEMHPVRQSFDIVENKTDYIFEIEQMLNWRSKGWISSDTHVHFLSPTTAELEGAAEDINVVNLLASQWGEMFTNVGDFDGISTHGSVHSGKSGEFLVRVGTENRMPLLGHISLLGYEGPMIQPLCTGGANESAIGDPQEVLMADWAEQCRRQGGLVVLPHVPNPLCEVSADIELGVIDALEMMVMNPHQRSINPYGLAEWYRYLNLGYHIPVVAGTDKMGATTRIGCIRTYTLLKDQNFSYENWLKATREGTTFVSIGPLLEFSVEGKLAGEKISLPKGGGALTIEWNVESLICPVYKVELIVNGEVCEEKDLSGAHSGKGFFNTSISKSSWVALRVRGSLREDNDEIAAHTSAIQVFVDDQNIFSKEDAFEILKRIEGVLAYLDTLAPSRDVENLKRMRLKIESAHRSFHQKMHQNGIFHQHSPVYDHH